MSKMEELEAKLDASIGDLARGIRTNWEDEIYDWLGKDAINPDIRARMEVKYKLEAHITAAIHQLLKTIDEGMRQAGVGRYER